VTALPRQLAHWKSHLALFPDDIALVLGPMVARLSALIGGAPFDQTPEGLPDGFHGIAARGTYDRLLAAEWLLLDELPDEFLRRAVSGEHLFLDRAYQAESAAKQTVALFDAGADQLGAPRLAQLAILIAMAKRADDSGATLKWGIFQDETAALHNGVTRALVRKLLGARCARLVTAWDIERWMATSEVRASSEIWFAGAETLMTEVQDRKASALIVSDVMEPGPLQRVHVRAVASGGTRAREAFLEAPAGAASVRILRDPFGMDIGGWQAASARVDIASNLVFSADGRKLFVRGEAGTVVAFPIPNSPRGIISRPQIFSPPPDQAIIAVGQTGSKRRTVVVTQGDGQFAVHTLSKRGGVARKTELFNSPDDHRPVTATPAFLRPLGVLRSKYLFIDAAGDFTELAGNSIAVKYGSDAVASRAAPNAFAYARRWIKGTEVVVARLSNSDDLEFEHSVCELPEMPQDPKYYFSPFVLSDIAAYSRQQSRCVIAHNLKVKALDIPRSHAIAGVVNFGDENPMLIVLREDKLHVEALQSGTPDLLFVASSPISRAAVSDVGPVIAYITEAGEVGIYSYAHRTMLHQFATGPAR
jgi:hypothetical protein